MSGWLHCPTPRPSARVRLVCFPHAGGAASFYRDWGGRLPDDIEVHAVRYPGRAERIDEPCATDLRALADDIAAAVAAVADRPVALFGHSLGAAVALETARSLAARGVQVVHLFASGSRDGDLPDLAEPSDDDDADMLRMLELGGTPPELAADPDFQELVLPYVRADSRLFHGYAHRADPALPCPVTAIAGDADIDADRRPWRELTPAFQQHVVPGNHFYLIENPPLALITTTLTRSGAAL
ncbi:thioesterase II family protein [Actinokineospora sp. NPDC004072]